MRPHRERSSASSQNENVVNTNVVTTNPACSSANAYRRSDMTTLATLRKFPASQAFASSPAPMSEEKNMRTENAASSIEVQKITNPGPGERNAPSPSS